MSLPSYLPVYGRGVFSYVPGQPLRAIHPLFRSRARYRATTINSNSRVRLTGFASQNVLRRVREVSPALPATIRTSRTRSNPSHARMRPASIATAVRRPRSGGIRPIRPRTSAFHATCPNVALLIQSTSRLPITTSSAIQWSIQFVRPIRPSNSTAQILRLIAVRWLHITLVSRPMPRQQICTQERRSRKPSESRSGVHTP